MKQFFRFLREWRFHRRDELINSFKSFSGIRRELLLAVTAITVLFGFISIVKISDYFAVEVPVVGGIITEGVVGVPRFINPVLAVSDTDKDFVNLVYSGLMKRLPDGTLVPDLAESYEISPDKRTYTFTIKENVKFHDGTPVTVEDVLYTISQIQNPAIQSPRRASWSGVGIKSEGDRKIIFTLQKPYSSFLDTATIGILPSSLWKETTPETFNFLTLNTEPIGSGPFMYESMEKKRNGIPVSYTFTRFKDYALGAPFIKEVNIKMYGNQIELARALENDDVSQAATLAPDVVLEIEKDKSKTVRTSTLPRVFGLFLNTNQKSLFTDRALVKLIDEAVAKDEIVTEVFDSYAVRSDGPVPFEPVISSRSIPEKRTEEAIQADFTRQGWVKNADGFLEHKTRKETLGFSLATADTPELVEVATKVRDNLGRYGIVVDLRIFDLGALNQNIIQPRSYDALLFGQVIENEADLYAFWHSSQRQYPGLNITQYANTRADALLESILGATDPVALKKDLELFDEVVRNDRPAILLYLPHFLYVTDSKVEGVELDRIANPSDRFSGVHRWYIETEPVWKIFLKNGVE